MWKPLLGPVWTRDSENDCPGASVTLRSHDDLLSRGNVAPGQLHCPGSTSLPRGKFIVIWSLRIYLNSFSFYTNCYREWILNRLTYFWCFLEGFIEKFILNIINEHAQDYSCPGATFAFCSHGEKLPRQGGLPGVVQLHCPGASSSSSDHYEFIWIPLVFTQIVTENEF